MSLQNEEKSPNMMEMICPESGIQMYNGELAATPFSKTPNAATSWLESLPPDLPSDEVINEPSTENLLEDRKTLRTSTTEISETSVLKNTGTLTHSSSPIQEMGGLYDRVKRLVESVRNGIDDLRDDHEELGAIVFHDRNTNDRTDDTPLCEEGMSDNEMEEKVRKALAKMKRLDNRLAQVAKKEREVKQQRKHVHSDTNHSESFLSIDDSSELLFRTQPIEREDKLSKNEIEVECVESGSHATENGSESGESNKSLPQHAKSFIERNKQLAGEKGEVLMTEGEKKRVEELLEEGENEETEVVVGGGTNAYSFTDEEVNMLEEIDKALDNMLLPLSMQTSLTTLSHFSDDQSSISGRGPINGDGCGPGEEVLATLQLERSELLRLKEIDDKLAYLRELGENNEVSYSLSEENIAALMEQCEM